MVEDERIVESFEQVYEEVFSVLIRIAYHITGNVDVAEELCQEAFLKYISRTVENSHGGTVAVLADKSCKKSVL